MKTPPIWDGSQLERDRLKAINEFRERRLAEPTERYAALFQEYLERFNRFFQSTSELTLLRNDKFPFSDSDSLELLRYLSGPPISGDDLKVIADTKLSKSFLSTNHDARQRIIATILRTIDQGRFPWITENRPPAPSERNAALIASAALLATSRVQTGRRNDEKNEQERSVGNALKRIGFSEVGRREISVISQAPKPGSFCGECLLGGRKADLIVRLFDERVMPIECKVSNSSTNSVKRLNNDAAAKAVSWRKDFGEKQTVPAVVLSGVYNLANLEDAQERGLTIFWAHNLTALTEWIVR